MIKYYKKKSFLQIEESWFDGQLSFRDLFSLKAVYHLKKDKKMIGIKEISHTIELDLEQDKQTILSNFSKANRQQIRKSEEGGVVIEVNNDIDQFVNFFNDFAAKKNTYLTTKERILEKKDCLVISLARYQNNIIAAQSYLVDKEQKIVRHYQTANKRFDDELDKNFVGHANKYLLVTNLMQFKEEGYKIFDFGGYANNTTNKSLQGINNYKLKFGGQIVVCNDYYSLPYWILRKVSKVFGSGGTV